MLSGCLDGLSIGWTYTALLLLLSMNLFFRRCDGGHGTLIFIWMQILVVVWVSLRAILVIQLFLVVEVNNVDGLRRTLQQLLRIAEGTIPLYTLVIPRLGTTIVSH